MSTWAIVPVKQLNESKRRLANVLSAEERAGLIHAFLDRLLDILGQVNNIDNIMLVTNDPQVISLGRDHNVDILVESEQAGLNTAVQRAADFATGQGASAMLVLPADLPYANVDDILLMLQPLAASSGTAKPLMVISGDDYNEGTNGLLLSLPGEFTFHYGPDSYDRHIAEADRLGLNTHVVHAPGLRFDLDTESDWHSYNDRLLSVTEKQLSEEV